MGEEPAVEKIQFQNHVIQLLEKVGKIPNSAKEVFLWDLIGVANGGLYRYRIKCLDKQRIESTKDCDFAIKIEADKHNNTLSITHNGIGMTKDELRVSIGCISEDCVNDYLDIIDNYLMNGDTVLYYSKSPNKELSYGVYSAFMVADRVVITTTPEKDAKKKPRDQYVWDASASDGFCRFTRRDHPTGNDLLKRGTKVTLYLKDEYLTYLDESKLGELAVKFKHTFGGCPYPIYVSDCHRRGRKRKPTAGKKQTEKEFKRLKQDFEGVRNLCAEALGNRVEKVVVNDRLFDLPGHLSEDTKRFVINPRNPVMKSLWDKFTENPDVMKEFVMETFILYYYMFKPRPHGDVDADAAADYDDNVATHHAYVGRSWNKMQLAKGAV